MSSSNLKSRVASALRWNVGAKLFTQIISWTMTIIVIRLLEPSDYGLMAMATVFVYFLVLLNELGLGAAIIQMKDLDHEVVRKIYGLVILVNCVLALLLFFGAILIADFFAEPRLVELIRVLSIQFIIMSFAVVPQSILERELNFKKKSLLEIFATLSGGVATLVIAYQGFGVWALLIGHLVIILVRTIGLNIIAPFKATPLFNFRGIGSSAGFGMKILVMRILWFLFARMDVFIIGRLLGKERLGVYSVGMDLASMPMQKINSITNQVAFPAFSRIQDQPRLITDYLVKAATIIAFVAFPVFVGIASVAPEIVHVVLGDKWHGALLPLQVLSLIMPLRMLGGTYPNVLQGINRVNVAIGNMSLATVLIGVALLIGVRWDITGVVIGWAIGYPLIFVLITYRTFKAINGESARLYATLLWPAVSSLVMFAGVALLRQEISGTVSATVQLLLLVISGAAIYLVMAALLQRQVYRQIHGLLRS